MAFPVAGFTCIVNSRGASLLCNICWQPMCRRVSLFCFSVNYLLFTSCYKLATKPVCGLTDGQCLLWELLWWCVRVEQDFYFWPRILLRGGVRGRDEGMRWTTKVAGGTAVCRGRGRGFPIVFVSPVWLPRCPIFIPEPVHSVSPTCTEGRLW